MLETVSAPSFTGRQVLTDRLDAAVAQADVDDITEAVKVALCDLIDLGQLDLPAALVAPVPGAYARRCLISSDDHGYVVVAMVWGPGQATALHDHDGVWCVEGVLQGEIEVTQYAALSREGARWRFAPQHTVKAGVGTGGCLIPPFEYHTIANAHDDQNAVTLHVYGRELQQAHIFDPQGDGWYVRETKQLGYCN